MNVPSFGPVNSPDASTGSNVGSFLLFENAPDAMMILSAEGRVAMVNKTFEELSGFTPHEVTGKLLEAVIHSDDAANVKRFVEELGRNSAVQHLECKIVKKDGRFCHVQWTGRLAEKDGMLILSGREVKNSQAAPAKQLTRESLFRAMIENSFEMLGLTDSEGRYLYLSETFKENFGYEIEDMLGTICFSYMHPDDLPRIMADNTVLHSQAKKIYVSPYRFRHAAGHWLWVESVVTNQLNDPDIRGIVISARDVTNQFNTGAKLKEMQLMEALQEGEEKERSRIARDLHDEISGMIAAAKMHFSSLTVQAPAIAIAGGYLQGMQLLENAALQVRRTSHNLMPEILLENGLTEALQRYCSNVSSNTLKIAFVSIGEVVRQSPKFELSLYRIAQELISNVLKHSGAGEALVQLSQYQAILSLTIEDNGRGFFPDDKMNGTGLQSIKNRVEAMNGFLEIHSEIGQGTHVYMEFER